MTKSFLDSATAVVSIYTEHNCVVRGVLAKNRLSQKARGTFQKSLRHALENLANCPYALPFLPFGIAHRFLLCKFVLCLSTRLILHNTRGMQVHCGASVRELHGALAFHSTAFPHLHTCISHNNSLILRSSPPPTVACKTIEAFMEVRLGY